MNGGPRFMSFVALQKPQTTVQSKTFKSDLFLSDRIK